MKKYAIWENFVPYKYERTFKIMRILILLTFTCLLSVHAHTSYSQEQAMSIALKNSSIREVFREIEKSSDYIFVLADNVGSTVDKRTDISVQDEKIDNILHQLLGGTSLSYRILDQQIVVYKENIVSNTSELLTESQTRKIVGVVVSEDGELQIGASILEKGTKNSTITDFSGRFSIDVTNPNATLVISFVGFVTKEINLKGNTDVRVVLAEDEKVLDEFVVVGYGIQKKESVTGSVSQISGDELLKRPVSNITNMLGGTIPGVISVQNSGQPGADASKLRVRGSQAKYIVDGIERPFAEIDPNEIASISVLKDGSAAAVYGLDAEAVIIVTTKRGSETSATRITFSGSYGISQNTKMLDLLDGPQYAHWYNKARELDGDTKPFTDAQVRKMLSGVDGWGNTNWYKKTFGTGHNSHYNVSASGGSAKIKYFTSVGNYNQDGNVDGFKFNRMNIRSNVDAKISEGLELSFDIAGRIEKRKSPGFGADRDDWLNIGQQALQSHPYLPETYEGVPTGTRTSSAIISPLASTTESGYNNSRRTSVQTNLALNYQMPFLKGLSAKALVAYDFRTTQTKMLSTPYKVYAASMPAEKGGDLRYELANDARNLKDASLYETSNNLRELTTNISLSYKNTFNTVHNVSALVVGESFRSVTNNFNARGYDFDIWELDELKWAQNKLKPAEVGGMSNERRRAGFVGRVNYDYAGRYLAEVSARYDGYDTFSGMSSKRWAVFPAASIGWRISDEAWFKEMTHFFESIKLRAGVGKTGSTSGVDQHIFYNTLSPDNAILVLNGVAMGGLHTNALGNTELTWAKVLQYNAGVDVSMFKGKLLVELDFFYKYMYDMIGAPSHAYPPSYGGYVHKKANINKQEHKGFEVLISYHDKIGDFSYHASFKGSYSKGKWLKYVEADNLPDWLQLSGKQVGSQQGFLADGFFQSQEEIDRAALIPGRAVRVGDIRYVDRNGDGTITYEQDRGYVAKPDLPIFTTGLELSGDWKGIDFSLSFVAGLGRDVALTGVYPNWVMSHTSMTRPFYQGGNSPRYLLENSWTPDNRNADFPRLGVASASTNNSYSSTLWYKNGNYLRLKSAQLGYTLPKSLMSYIRAHSLRVYVEGSNLFTLSGLNKYYIDPEQPGVSNGYYPQQRVISGGVKLTF